MAIKMSHAFLMRKLHQLTGIVPLGAFFAVHMFTNAKAMGGKEAFNDAVKDIHAIPFLLFVEIFGIFLPLLFHSVYGIVISGEARNNVLNYAYGRNWLYVLQRASGIFLFFFIFFHILHLRFGLIPGLTPTAVAGNADTAYQIVAGEFQTVWIMAFYILGVVATAWHLAYGIFLFAVDWGLVIGEKAQAMVLKGCVAVALLLSIVGINAAFAFVRPCGLMPEALCESPKAAAFEAPKGKPAESRKY